MGKPTFVPITPSVLTWAIRESGYSPHTVAQKVGVSLDTVEAWMQGPDQPKLTEFRKLVGLLKRTPSLFLLPEQPDRPTPTVEFRRPPDTDRTTLNPTERRYLREASRLQDLLLWVQGELMETVETLPHLRTDRDPETAASQARRALVTPRSKPVLRSASEAFRLWCRALEQLGVLVFSFRLGRDGVRGFSIWHDRAPVIAVNTFWRHEARTYTLFHEFGHLLTRTASACLEARRRHLAHRSDPIERWCEKFSAAILLPRDEVEVFLTQELRRPLGLRVKDLDVPSALANRFKVSLRAATLRLIEMQLAAWDLYNQIPPVADNKPRGGGRGLERSQIRERQYGDRTVRLLINALRRDVLGRADVLDTLDISDADLSKLEAR